MMYQMKAHEMQSLMMKTVASHCQQSERPIWSQSQVKHMQHVYRAVCPNIWNIIRAYHIMVSFIVITNNNHDLTL